MSFDAYWAEYLAAHSHPAVRRAHVAATGAALLCAAAGIVARQRWLVLSAAGVAIVPAWLSHRVVRYDAPLPQEPLYSVFANLLLFWKTLDGSLASEIEQLRNATPKGVPVDDVPAPNMATDGTLH